VTGASVLPELRTAAQQAAISGRKDRKLTDRAVAALTEGVLADEVLTREEEDYVLETIEAIGIGDEDMQTRYQPLMKQLALGRANDGRLQVLDHDTHLMPQRGESVHLEMPAGLLKEVTLREFRGGSAGVSVRVAKGVRVSSGRMRGRMVTVGTELQTVDAGWLSITSHRVVFSGLRSFEWIG